MFHTNAPPALKSLTFIPSNSVSPLPVIISTKDVCFRTRIPERQRQRQRSTWNHFSPAHIHSFPSCPGCRWQRLIFIVYSHQSKEIIINTPYSSKLYSCVTTTFGNFCIHEDTTVVVISAAYPITKWLRSSLYNICVHCQITVYNESLFSNKLTILWLRQVTS